MKRYPLAFVDTETTGLDYRKNEMIEIGLVLATIVNIDNQDFLQTEEELEWKIKPTNLDQADPRALEINGYNEAEWLFAPSLEAVLENFSQKTARRIIVAHNLVFDWAFISEAYKKTGLKDNSAHIKLDTLGLAYTKLDKENIPSLSLKALANYYQVVNERAHTALADAKTTKSIFSHLLDIRER